MQYKSKLLNEQYTSVTLDSGLQILICPKPGYSSAYAVFGTRYGSVDTKFRRACEDEYTVVPEGIAHFLEHKLFESEDGDVFGKYAETGASANAYTSFDRTCYLFSCSGDFDRNFSILLDFVQSPYFTKETVEKEQGIIGQEIRMYDDSAPWRVFFNLLTALFHNHPVRIDIAGTVESISKIDHELLYKCYRTFYNPANMFVCVAGNVDPEKIIEQVRGAIKPAESAEIIREIPEEPDSVLCGDRVQTLPVSMPLFALGFKEHCENPQKTPSERAAAELLLDVTAGNASPLYRSLFDDGLINDNFEFEYFTGYYYAVSIFSGESSDPQRVRERINDELARIAREGISDEMFENSRRKLYGHSIMRYNNVESVGSSLVQAAFSGESLWSETEAFKNITKAEVLAHLSNLVPARSSISLILPQTQAQAATS